jgi:hypothetical protein
MAFAMTECNQSSFGFAALYRREVMAEFDGSDITTDAGGLLLREVDRRLSLIERLTACFTGHRRPDQVEHQVSELVAQRLYGLALGYEDLNDHDQLRADPLIGVLVGKAYPKGRTAGANGIRARRAPARARSTGWLTPASGRPFMRMRLVQRNGYDAGIPWRSYFVPFRIVRVSLSNAAWIMVFRYVW